ncbi:MAG: hypothetical protein QXF82_03085 [Nitrososphaeria archaeon]
MKALEDTLNDIESVLEIADLVAQGKVKMTERGINEYSARGYLGFLWASICNEYVRSLDLYKFAREQGLKRASEDYKIRYLRLKGAVERLKPYIRAERALEMFIESLVVEGEEGGEDCNGGRRKRV